MGRRASPRDPGDDSEDDHDADDNNDPVLQTFIFDCEHDREVARQTNKSSNSSQVCVCNDDDIDDDVNDNKSTNYSQVPTFDWSLQFTPEQVLLFTDTFTSIILYLCVLSF